MFKKMILCACLLAPHLACKPKTVSSAPAPKAAKGENNQGLLSCEASQNLIGDADRGTIPTSHFNLADNDVTVSNGSLGAGNTVVLTFDSKDAPGFLLWRACPVGSTGKNCSPWRKEFSFYSDHGNLPAGAQEFTFKRCVDDVRFVDIGDNGQWKQCKPQDADPEHWCCGPANKIVVQVGNQLNSQWASCQSKANGLSDQFLPLAQQMIDRARAYLQTLKITTLIQAKNKALTQVAWNMAQYDSSELAQILLSSSADLEALWDEAIAENQNSPLALADTNCSSSSPNPMPGISNNSIPVTPTPADSPPATSEEAIPSTGALTSTSIITTDAATAPLVATDSGHVKHERKPWALAIGISSLVLGAIFTVEFGLRAAGLSIQDLLPNWRFDVRSVHVEMRGLAGYLDWEQKSLQKMKEAKDQKEFTQAENQLKQARAGIDKKLVAHKFDPSIYKTEAYTFDNRKTIKVEEASVLSQKKTLIAGAKAAAADPDPAAKRSIKDSILSHGKKFLGPVGAMIAGALILGFSLNEDADHSFVKDLEMLWGRVQETRSQLATQNENCLALIK